jgi:hypothetical protein
MFCQCGCGGITSIVKTNYTNNGRVKGEYCRYIQGHSLIGHRGPGGAFKSKDKDVAATSRQYGSIRLAMLLADRNLKKRIRK